MHIDFGTDISIGMGMGMGMDMGMDIGMDMRTWWNWWARRGCCLAVAAQVGTHFSVSGGLTG